MMEDAIKTVDAIIYVLDSRAAFSCLNPVLNDLCKDKPIVYALNKADLISKIDLDIILKTLKADGKAVIALNSTASKTALVLASEIKKLCEERLSRLAARGIKAVTRAMVIGIPNSGKSTLINNLHGSAAATTGNKAGVTRGKQWIKINPYFEVIDTPGTLYPKLKNQDKARRLAYIGSINDDILDKQWLALELISELDKLNSEFISQRYKIENGNAEIRLLGIAKSRGFIKKGGEADELKGASALIDDFRKGRLGKIALETADI